MSQDVIVLSDRIKELSHSTGLGNFILDGAVQGFSTFSSFYSYNDALFYAITDGTNYEVGSGQYILDGSNKSLKRFPFRSTNSNNLVNFTNGAKEVYVTYPGKYSVFTASGLANFQQPQSSGLAFWGSDQILDYDSNIVWNTSQNKLGISQNNPSYAIDVGGLSSYSAIRASGFIVGNSGILFPLDRQLEPFLRNELDVTTGTEAVFNLEGTVDEQIKFKIQHASWVFAGPTGNCTLNPSCPSGYPTFRILHINDIPDLSNLYVQQKSTAYGDSLPNGMMSGIAFWNQSGIIDYDSYLVWNKTNNYLGVNTKTPAANLDVDGNAIIRTNLTVGGNVTVTGNLDIQGSTTYIDSTVVTILDKQLELASMSGAAIYNDASIDDAGIVIKSTDSDKKWTWRDSNDAWTTDQKLKTSGIIFNDLSVISGAYQAGSGLTLHNGLKFNIGNMFSTQTSDNSQLLVHQADVITVSGISGIKTYLDSANKRIVINPFDLIANQNIQDLANTNSGIAISGWANSTINASGNLLNDKIISVSGWTSSYIGLLNRTPSGVVFFGNNSQLSISNNLIYNSSNGDIKISGSYCGFGTNIKVGNGAGSSSVSNSQTIMIGQSAGQSSGCSYTNMIGHLAGYVATGCNYTNMIGLYAGYGASGCDDTNMIGVAAGYGASGCIYTNMIGELAGFRSVGCQYSNFIGYQSGSGCISSHSTYIGYQAGTYNQFNNNIFIKALDTNHTLDWISPTIQGLQANLLSIADTITGDTSLKYIRIGQTGIMGDINNATLTVKPKLATDTAVKIFRATSQSVPLLVSELSTAANNTIINKDGFLTIPTYDDVATATGAIPVVNVGAMAFAISGSVFLISNGSNWKQSAAFTTVV